MRGHFSGLGLGLASQLRPVNVWVKVLTPDPSSSDASRLFDKRAVLSRNHTGGKPVRNVALLLVAGSCKGALASQNGNCPQEGFFAVSVFALHTSVFVARYKENYKSFYKRVCTIRL